MADKTGNPQPQSGDPKSEREKHFRMLPEDKNKDEVGQDRTPLAPLLHWDIDRRTNDSSE